ncbi:MAG: MarC family protein [Burkholderiales bacterium]|nr:MarC family protein [Burkholderiales bacterium]
MSLVQSTILLVLVLDPFGNVPLVANALKAVPEHRRARVVLRELAIAYAVLVLFLIGGGPLLALLNLSETSLSIAGGVILFLIALRMVFPRGEGLLGDVPDGEPLVVPIAIPLIAGPSALATVIVLASRAPHGVGGGLAALTAAMAVSAVVLLFAERIARRLGKRGTAALERLMGLLLTAIAVELTLSGIERFVAQMPK